MQEVTSMATSHWSHRLAVVGLFLVMFPAAARAADATVEIRGSQFEPAEITVAVGEPVTWTNYDGDGVSAFYRHNAVALDESWRTPLLQTDESATLTFDAVATYEYFCSLHAGMRGTLNVVEASLPSTDTVDEGDTEGSHLAPLLTIGLAAGVIAFAMGGRRQRMTRR